MTRRSFIGYVVAPTLAAAAYFVCLMFLPIFAKHFLHSERALYCLFALAGLFVALEEVS